MNKFVNKKILLKSIPGIIFIVLGLKSLQYFSTVNKIGVTFSGFFSALGLLLLITGIAIILIPDKYFSKLKKLIRVLVILAILFTISFAITEGIIINSGEKAENAGTDYIVVLGAAVKGKTPSLILSERLGKSLVYINKHPDTKIILSGGRGPGEDITEAEAMKKYLISKGVDESKIIKEEKSTNTFENLKNSKKIIEGLQETQNVKNVKIEIVTSDFHMFRAKMLAKREGFTAYGYPSETPKWLAPLYYTREYFAAIKSLISDR